MQHSTDHASSARKLHSWAMEYRRLGSTGLKVGCWHGGEPAMRRMCSSSMLTSPTMLVAESTMGQCHPTSPVVVCLQVSVLSFGAWVTFGTQVSPGRQRERTPLPNCDAHR